MGYALVGLCAVHCRTLAARYGRGAGLRQEMIRGITRRTDESAPTVLFLQQRRPPPSRPRPPRDGPQALEIKGFRDSRHESTRFSPSEPPAPTSTAIRAYFPACESALRATGGRFCRIDPPIRPPCRFAQAGVPQLRAAPPGSISRPDGAPPSPERRRSCGGPSEPTHDTSRRAVLPAPSRAAGSRYAPNATAFTGRPPAPHPPLQPAAFRGAARPIRQLSDPRQAPARRPACKAAACPTSPDISGRLRRGACTASARRPCSLRPFEVPRAWAANSRIRTKPPPAALPAKPQPVQRPRTSRAASTLRAPQPPLTDRLRRIRPPPLQPAAFRGAARPIRQLPDPRQAPARRPACTAAACPTSPEISGRLRRGACAASALRPRSLWPFDALRPGPPTPGSAPSSRPTPCSLRLFAAPSHLRHRGPRAAAMLRAPQPSLADRLRRIRPSTAWPLALRLGARPIRQLPHPRQAPARRLACEAAACPTSPDISGRRPPRCSKRRSPHWLIACAASARRPCSLRPFEVPRPGQPTPGSAPRSARRLACTAATCPISPASRGASMLQVPQPPLTDRLRRIRRPPRSLRSFAAPSRLCRQLPHPRQAPARRPACKAAACPTSPDISDRRPPRRSDRRSLTGRPTAPHPPTASHPAAFRRAVPPPPKRHSRRCPTSPASRIASAQAPASGQTAAAPAFPRRPSTRAAKFGIIAGGTAPSRRTRHRARDDATARRRGSAMARQRGGGIAACAARPAAPAPGRRRAPPQPGSSQTSRGETP